MLKETKDYLIEFGKRVRTVRNKLGLSQKNFAHRSGVVASYLSNIENGKGNPTYDFFLRLYQEFDVNMNYLIGGIGPLFQKEKGEIPSLLHLVKTQLPQPSNLNSTEHLVWFMGHSPMFKNSILGYAARLYYETKDQVKSEIEQTENIEILHDPKNRVK